MLTNYFGKPMCFQVNPDEAVAYGATVQAAILQGAIGGAEDTNHINFTDVTPLTLGILVYGGGMDNIVNRNSQLPISVTKKYRTSCEN